MVAAARRTLSFPEPVASPPRSAVAAANSAAHARYLLAERREEESGSPPATPVPARSLPTARDDGYGCGCAGGGGDVDGGGAGGGPGPWGGPVLAARVQAVGAAARPSPSGAAGPGAGRGLLLIIINQDAPWHDAPKQNRFAEPEHKCLCCTRPRRHHQPLHRGRAVDRFAWAEEQRVAGLLRHLPSLSQITAYLFPPCPLAPDPDKPAA